MANHVLHTFPDGTKAPCAQEDTIDAMRGTLNTISAQVASLKGAIEGLSNKLDGGHIIVSLTNGDGLPAMVKLNDFVQTMYDRPTETVKKAESALNRTVSAVKNIAFVVGMIIIIYTTMSNMSHIKSIQAVQQSTTAKQP